LKIYFDYTYSPEGYELCTPKIIRKIVRDYEQSGGTFSLTVTDENTKSALEQKAQEVGLAILLQNRIKIEPSADAAPLKIEYRKNKAYISERQSSVLYR
jgi:hypothetical protein